MIKQKLKACKECGKECYLFSKGRCKYCASKSYVKKQTKERQDFFQKHVELLKKNPVCQQTGDYISTPSKINIAHLLPKRNHKSVAENDLNVIYLSWQTHTTFDELLDRHEFEKIEKNMPKVWKSLLNVLPLCKEQTKLVTALKNYNEQ